MTSKAEAKQTEEAKADNPAAASEAKAPATEKKAETEKKDNGKTPAAVEKGKEKEGEKPAAEDKKVDEKGKEGAAAATSADITNTQDKQQKQGETTSSEEQRIRGGGKVTGGRGRDNRRHQPYRGGGDRGGPGDGGDEDRGRRVYVGNLAWEVSWQDLKDHMKTTGHEVNRANVMMTPDGRSKGCGIVEFATVEGAQAAVATLNDTELSGRQIFVREDREDRNSGGGGGGGAGFHSYNTPLGGGGGHHGGGPPHHGGGAPPAAAGGGHRFSSGEQAQPRRVYVGNLSWDVAWQDLKDHMRQAGDVAHAEIICENNGRSKGCGIVEFATAAEAQEAIATLTDTELKGRMIFVREDRETTSGASHGGFGGHHHHGGGGGGRGHGPHAGHVQNTSVYIWNLSYETSWQDLKDHMRKAGNVDQATILTDPQGQSIGCAVCVYQRPQEAARAIRELQNSELNGRNIYVREDRVQSGGGGGHHGGGGRGGGRGHHQHGGGRGGYHGGGGGGGGDGGSQLFVGNLSYDTTWKELKDHFRQCGDVERAEVITNPDGRSKGFGTVRFYNRKDAEGAIERLNGIELQGRSLEVRHDNKAH